MGEMTRKHLEAVRQAKAAMLHAAYGRGLTVEAMRLRHAYAARLSEVAAMIEAKMESRDEG